MSVKGQVAVRAPRKKVWGFLTDPKQIDPCASGVEKIEEIEPMKRDREVISVGLGGAKARFNGEGGVLEELNRAKLKAHGMATGSDC